MIHNKMFAGVIDGSTTTGKICRNPFVVNASQTARFAVAPGGDDNHSRSSWDVPWDSPSNTPSPANDWRSTKQEAATLEEDYNNDRGRGIKKTGLMTMTKKKRTGDNEIVLKDRLLSGSSESEL